jgi:uncharacterized membrane protein YpjA
MCYTKPGLTVALYVYCFWVITNDVSDYINLLVRIVHIICNHPLHTHTSVLCIYVYETINSQRLRVL